MVSTGYSSAISRLHQRAVAFDYHQRCVDRLVRHHARQCLDQVANLRRETGVERRRERAPRSIELRAQLMRAGHGLRRQLANQLARAQFMRRIAHRKIRRDGERLDARLVCRDGARDCGFVERRRLLPGRAVAALDAYDQAAAARALQPGALDHRIVEADQQRAHRTEAILDDGVGGERGRHGDQADVLPARVRGQQREHRANRLTDAERQIPRRGQRLGARDDAALGEQHRIGEGSARVEAKPEALISIDRAHRRP